MEPPHSRFPRKQRQKSSKCVKAMFAGETAGRVLFVCSSSLKARAVSPAVPQHPDFPWQSPQQSPQQFWGIGPRGSLSHPGSSPGRQSPQQSLRQFWGIGPRGSLWLVSPVSRQCRDTVWRLSRSERGHQVPESLPSKKGGRKRWHSVTRTRLTKLGRAIHQQFTYGVVSEGVFAESLRKFCGKLRKFYQKYVLLRQERVRKFCGKLQTFRGNLQKIFCNDPFPNDPMSELLNPWPLSLANHF